MVKEGNDSHLIVQWAQQYEPLSIHEEHKLFKEHRDNEMLLMTKLIQHNSRAIFNLANKYRTNIPLDDALSLGLNAAVKMFQDGWDREYRFSTGMMYYVRNALSNELKRSQIIATPFEYNDIEEESYDENFDDLQSYLWAQLEEVLNPEEADFMKMIYIDQLAICEAGRIVYGDDYRKKSSERHKQLLAKLKASGKFTEEMK